MPQTQVLPPPIAIGSPPAHVLIIEDSDGNRRVLETLLRSAGYSIDGVTSGRAALQQTTARRPDIVITDAVLPDMAATTLIRQLRAQGCVAPVLLVCGYISPEARRATQRAAAYLMKPYDIDALLGAVFLLTAPSES